MTARFVLDEWSWAAATGADAEVLSNAIHLLLERLDVARERNEGVVKHTDYYEATLGDGVQLYSALFEPDCPRLLHKSWHVIVTRTPTFRVANASQNSPCSIRPLPRLSTDSIGGLSSPTVNWNHTRLRLQNLVFCGANACSDRKVMQLAGVLCNSIMTSLRGSVWP